MLWESLHLYVNCKQVYTFVFFSKIELTCPSNSRYVHCGSPCAASCAQPMLPATTFWPVCLEGCQCEPGFVQNGINCVPHGQCGCTYNGRYYLAGETFWQGENCQSFCSCNGSTHAVECATSSCTPGEVCDIQEGVYGCYTQPDGTCQAYGFLHYITFDRQRYDMNRTTKNSFARLCQKSKSSPSFRVDVTTRKHPNSAFSVISEIFVLVNETRIQLQEGHQSSVKVRTLPQHCTFAAWTNYLLWVCSLGAIICQW